MLLAHIALVTPYGYIDLGHQWITNGTKLLPEPMLTSH